jgi:hypothetical protein
MGIEEEKKKKRKGYIPTFVHTVYNYTKKKEKKKILAIKRERPVL